MKINLIMSLSSNDVLGDSDTNDLLFHISNDMKRFRNLTEYGTVVMGRNTFLSLPKGGLPNRHHIIISSTLTNENAKEKLGDRYVPGMICMTLDHFESVIVCNTWSDNVLNVIGGGQLFTYILTNVICCRIESITITHIKKKINIKNPITIDIKSAKEHFLKTLIASGSDYCKIQKEVLDYEVFKYTRMCNVTNKEKEVWLKSNCFDFFFSRIDLSGLSFDSGINCRSLKSDGTIDNSQQRAGSIDNTDQEAIIHINNSMQNAKDIDNSYQEAKKIYT